MSKTTTPGLSIGPMDVDEAGEFASTIKDHNKAHLLLQHAVKNYPKAVRDAFLLPADAERSEAAEECLEDVTEVLSDLKGREGWLPEGAEIEGAAVRGRKTSDRIITVVYRAASGRSGRGILSYERVPAIERKYEEQKAEKAAENAPASAAPVDLDKAAKKAVKDAEERATTAETAQKDLLDRLERLENPEPWEGYDDENGDEIIKRLESTGLDEFGTAGLDQIAAYEDRETGKKRKGVLAAVSAAKSPPGA